MRFELTTLAMARRCSTTEPHPHILVREKGLEPPRQVAQDPKSCASASSATPANNGDPSAIRTRDTLLKRQVL